MIELLAILATWRISHLVSEEEGPGNILGKLRSYFIEGGEPDGRPKNWFGKALQCPYCISIYVAFLIAIYFSYGNWWLLPLYTAAFSAGSILVDIMHDKIKG